MPADNSIAQINEQTERKAWVAPQILLGTLSDAEAGSLATPNESVTLAAS